MCVHIYICIIWLHEKYFATDFSDAVQFQSIASIMHTNCLNKQLFGVLVEIEQATASGSYFQTKIYVSCMIQKSHYTLN